MTRSLFLIAASALLLSQVGGATALPKVGQGTAACAAPLTILVLKRGCLNLNCSCGCVCYLEPTRRGQVERCSCAVCPKKRAQ
jgi:hypothetical protein